MSRVRPARMRLLVDRRFSEIALTPATNPGPEGKEKGSALMLFFPMSILGRGLGPHDQAKFGPECLHKTG